MTVPTLTPTARVAIMAALGVLAAAVLVYFLQAPERARKAEARAEATEAISEAAQGAARETVTHYDRYVEHVQRIDERTENTNANILRAPGAEQRLAPELDRAGRIALCLHDNRHDAVCELLLHRHDGKQEPAGSDAARPAPR